MVEPCRRLVQRSGCIHARCNCSHTWHSQVRSSVADGARSSCSCSAHVLHSKQGPPLGEKDPALQAWHSRLLEKVPSKVISSPAWHTVMAAHAPARPAALEYSLVPSHSTQDVAGLESTSVDPSAHCRFSQLLVLPSGTKCPAPHATHAVDALLSLSVVPAGHVWQLRSEIEVSLLTSSCPATHWVASWHNRSCVKDGTRVWNCSEPQTARAWH